ncbi:phage holin family protein [Streptomyces goshikiensis]|uniref:phage holin family protein n=1 Tax=Streptomyces goshikiensis TaxID=1942 RepID=UPI00331EEADE
MLGVFAGLALPATCIAALVLPVWVAALVAIGALAAVAAITVLAARSRSQRPAAPLPAQALDSVKGRPSRGPREGIPMSGQPRPAPGTPSSETPALAELRKKVE